MQQKIEEKECAAVDAEKDYARQKAAGTLPISDRPVSFGPTFPVFDAVQY